MRHDQGIPGGVENSNLHVRNVVVAWHVPVDSGKVSDQAFLDRVVYPLHSKTRPGHAWEPPWSSSREDYDVDELIDG